MYTNEKKKYKNFQTVHYKKHLNNFSHNKPNNRKMNIKIYKFLPY